MSRPVASLMGVGELHLLAAERTRCRSPRSSMTRWPCLRGGQACARRSAGQADGVAVLRPMVILREHWDDVGGPRVLDDELIASLPRHGAFALGECSAVQEIRGHASSATSVRI